MNGVPCPGCGETVSLEGVEPGDRMDCPNCANLTLRVQENEGDYSLVEIPKASCPSCERLCEVPDGLGPGDIMKCCGDEYVLTYEFGTFAMIAPRCEEAH